MSRVSLRMSARVTVKRPQRALLRAEYRFNWYALDGNWARKGYGCRIQRCSICYNISSTMNKPLRETSVECRDEANTLKRTESFAKLSSSTAHRTWRAIPFPRNLNAIHRWHIATELENLGLQVSGDSCSIVLLGGLGSGEFSGTDHL